MEKHGADLGDTGRDDLAHGERAHGERDLDEHRRWSGGRLASGLSRESLSSNAIPLALVGAGVAWMLFSRAQHTESYDQARRWTERRTRGLRRRVRQRYEDARDQVSETAGRLRDKASHLRGSDASDPTAEGYDRIADYDGRRDKAIYGESAYRAQQGSTEQVRGTVGRVADSFWNLVDDHPIAAGLMGIALGTAIGASLPATAAENELVGEYRDEWLQRARDIGEEAVQQAQAVAREAAKAGSEAVEERLRGQPG